jgi:DDE family transposase
VRALAIVRQQLHRRMQFLHAKRRAAVFRCVEGVIRGGRLWLTGLGRNLPGRTSDKHRVKAVDRLLGNSAIHRALPALYQVFAHWLLGGNRHPVILIDSTGLTTTAWEFRAALCFEGRALPLYSEIHPARQMEPAVLRTFLCRLATLLPAGCQPTLVTDAGFPFSWFTAVHGLGWNFVGRIRNNTKILVGSQWISNKELHRQASARSQDLGQVPVRKRSALTIRLVLAKKRTSKRRVRKTALGRPGQGTVDRRCESAAREPWLLATNLESPSDAIVGIYARRMQIEESIRDSKSHRHGWALSYARSNSHERLAVLVFLGALATVIAHVAGLAAERMDLHRRFQSNTVRNRRVLSLFTLGRRILAIGIHLPGHRLREALAAIRSRAGDVSFA